MMPQRSVEDMMKDTECAFCRWNEDKDPSIQQDLMTIRDVHQLFHYLGRLGSRRSKGIATFINAAIYVKDKWHLLLSLPNPLASEFLERIKKVVAAGKECLMCIGKTDPKLAKIHQLLIEFSSREGFPPRDLLLQGILLDETISTGGSADISFARLNNQPVALKRLRTTTGGSSRLSDLTNDSITWYSLYHPNVQDFLGIYQDTLSLSLYAVSLWQENGTLLQCLRRLRHMELPINVDVWIKQIASGLSYLHDQNLVYNDLSCGNILVGAHYTPKLAGYGFCLSESKHRPVKTSVGMRDGATKFTAPELLRDPHSQPNFASDMYSFACLCLEIYTGEAPFPGLTNEQAFAMIMRCGPESTPRPPSHWTSALPGFWNFMEQCWQEDPNRRPPRTSLSSLPLRGSPLSGHDLRTLPHDAWTCPLPRHELSRPRKERDYDLDPCILGLLDIGSTSGIPFSEVGNRLATLGCPETTVRIVWRALTHSFSQPKGKPKTKPVATKTLVSLLLDTERIPNYARYSHRCVPLAGTLVVQKPSQQGNTRLYTSLESVTQNICTLRQHEMANPEGRGQGVIAHQRRFARQQVTTSFESLATILESLGRQNAQGSQRPCEHAQKIRETLSQKPSVGINRLLSHLLFQLAAVYAEFGMHKEAAMRGEECLEIVRLLFQVSPKQWRKTIYDALESLARDHFRSKHYKESISFGCEAAGILRTLPPNNMKEYRDKLSELLPLLIEAHHEDGQHSLCVYYGKEAIDVLVKLSKENPQEWKSRLATTIHRLCFDLYDLGRYHEVEKWGLHVATILQELVNETRSTEFDLQLVSVLHLTARGLHRLSKFEEAVAVRNQALHVCWMLVNRHPNSYEAKLALAQTRHDLAYSHQHLGDDEKAIGFYELSVVETRKMVSKDPRSSNPLLAATLQNLANTWRQRGQHQKAATYGREAVQVWSELSKYRPSDLPFLAECLQSLSSDFLQLADMKKAIQYAQEATDLYRKLAQGDSQHYGPLHASSLQNLQNLQPHSKRTRFK